VDECSTDLRFRQRSPTFPFLPRHIVSIQGPNVRLRVPVGSGDPRHHEPLHLLYGVRRWFARAGTACGADRHDIAPLGAVDRAPRLQGVFGAGNSVDPAGAAFRCDPNTIRQQAKPLAAMLPSAAITRSSTHAGQPMRSASGEGEGGALKAARSALAALTASSSLARVSAMSPLAASTSWWF
jgi:hypothetical protein